MTAIKTRTTWIVSVFLLLTLFAGLVMPAAGQDVLAIYTDRPDYAPGETVTLTGTGRQPGEAVRGTYNDGREVADRDPGIASAAADCP